MTDVLEKRLGISHAVTGFDFHFGKNRQGGPAFLMASGERHGFGVTLVDAFRDEGAEIVSSSRIRALLEEGDVAEAAGLLGYRFTVEAEVTGGKKLGRTLGFPTANMTLPADAALRHGIYAVRFRRPTARSMTAWRASAAARPSTRTARRCSRPSCSIFPAISTARPARCRSSASCAARRNSTGSTRSSRR